jgi:hypothetical protein
MHMGSNERGAYYDKTGKGQRYLSDAVVDEQKNWPSPVASEVRQGFQDRSKGMNTGKLSEMVNYGQAAPANSNTLGSRQGLWPTARSLDGQLGESLETWTARHHRKEAQGINLHRPLPIAVMQEQAKTQDFPTPRTCDWKSSPNASQNEKRMEAGQATLGEFVHAKHKKGDLWSTPRTGATESSRPNNKGGIPLADQAKREQWATPQAKDHKSGHRDPTIVQYKQLNVEVEAKATGKLNPRWVETLMGLPIGWTMPSCTSPVTIAPTSCDSLGTALCQPAQSERSDFLLAS